MNPVVHFEMPAKDRKRVSEFYSTVFGWHMVQLGEEMGNYILASTTDTDQKTGRPKDPGAINGGFWETDKNEPPHLVIAVDDIEKHMQIVKDAGGTVEGEPMDIKGIGTFVMITDTEGNRVGILQPSQM